MESYTVLSVLVFLCCTVVHCQEIQSIDTDSPFPEPPIDIRSACAAAICPVATVCRIVHPCDICEPRVQCVPGEVLGDGIDIECQRKMYTQALLVENFDQNNNPNYSLLKCRGVLATRDCPRYSICVDDLRGGGTCCTGKDKPTIKPGVCPSGPIFVCGGVPCQVDSNCPGPQKCCDGCGRFCTNPVPDPNERCGSCPFDHTCVDRPSPCPPGRFCIQIVESICVPNACLNCGPGRRCLSKPLITTCLVGSPCPTTRYFCEPVCGLSDTCPLGQKCVPNIENCLGPSCTEDVQCVPDIDQCGGCPDDQMCIDTGLRCVKAPCPGVYKCVVRDECGGCPKGQKCGLLFPSCLRHPPCGIDDTSCPRPLPCIPIPTCVDDTSPVKPTTSRPPVCGLKCPPNSVCQFVNAPCKRGHLCLSLSRTQCVPLYSDEDQCGGCPKDKMCIDTGLRCVKAPCPGVYKCVARDECGGCPKGETCELLFPPCARPTPCGIDESHCPPPVPCIPIPTCVDDTSPVKPTTSRPPVCGLKCPPNSVCQFVNAPCKRGHLCLSRTQCVPLYSDEDQCGGCPKDQMCIDTGLRCVKAPCPGVYKCVARDECGGCPKGKKCELVLTPCAGPPPCGVDEYPCPPPLPCNPSPTCVDDISPVKPTTSRPPVCGLRCPPNYVCQFVNAPCKRGHLCLTNPLARCVPRDVEEAPPAPGRYCPRPYKKYALSSFICRVEVFKLRPRLCSTDRDCPSPAQKCCTSKCNIKVCLYALAYKKRGY